MLSDGSAIKNIYNSKHVIFYAKNYVSSPPPSSLISNSAPIFTMDGINDENFDNQSTPL